MNTITIALCQEDRARLDKIIEALERTQMTPAEVPAAAQDEPQTVEVPAVEVPVAAEETAEASNEETAPEPAEEPAKAVTLSDIQKKVVEMSAAGKKDEVREIITKYASRVSAIPAEKTAEVWEQLTRSDR